MHNIDHTSNENIIKPNCIIEYNKHISGNNKSDQTRPCFSITRKSVKWSKKIALYLINCALVNAFVLYKKHNFGTILAFSDFVNFVGYQWVTAGIENVNIRELPPNRSHCPVKTSKKPNCKQCCERAREEQQDSFAICAKYLALHKGECFLLYHKIIIHKIKPLVRQSNIYV